MKKWIRGHRVAVTWGLFGLSLAVLALALVLHAVVPNTRPQPSVAVTPGRLTVTIEPTATLRITYLGDSLTAGLHAVEETDSFRSRTTEALASGGPVEEQATKIVGGTVRQTLEGNPDLPNDQDIYVVQLGTNDFNDGDYRAFQRDYGELLDRVRAASPDAALVCLGTWRPAEQASRWDLVIRGACEAHNGRYDRMSDLAADDTMVGPAGRDTFSGPSDDFHPNNAGHRAISDRLMAMVEVERIG